MGGMRPQARGCPETQKLQETGNISSKAIAIEDFKMKVLKMLPLKLLIQYMFPLLNLNKNFKKKRVEIVVKKYIYIYPQHDWVA